jgi:hypothetical protein
MRKIQMNERIRELAEQATTIVDTVNSQGYTSSYANFDREKFAELIVRECAQVCADRGKHHDGLYSAWASDCSERIEKHFGVEE